MYSRTPTRPSFVFAMLDNADKLPQSLLNTTIDLNPHQIEAALFAFRSPLSRGAGLADEVGLFRVLLGESGRDLSSFVKALYRVYGPAEIEPLLG